MLCDHCGGEIMEKCNLTSRITGKNYHYVCGIYHCEEFEPQEWYDIFNGNNRWAADGLLGLFPFCPSKEVLFCDGETGEVIEKEDRSQNFRFAEYMYKNGYIIIRPRSNYTDIVKIINLNNSLLDNMALIEEINKRHHSYFRLSKAAAKRIYGNAILKDERYLTLYDNILKDGIKIPEKLW